MIRWQMDQQFNDSTRAHVVRFKFQLLFPAVMGQDVFEDHTEHAGCFDFYYRVWQAGDWENLHAVIGNPILGDGLICDPKFHLGEIFERAARDGVPIREVLITHGHWDHIGGIGEAAKLGAKIFHLPAGLEGKIATTGLPNVHWVKNGEQFVAAGVKVTAMHLPGHTPEHTCYLVGEPNARQVILTGDLLFIDSSGRADFEGGSKQEMFDSLQTLKSISGDPMVSPGHHYGFQPVDTLSSQLVRNPALATEEFGEFSKLRFLKG